MPPPTGRPCRGPRGPPNPSPRDAAAPGRAPGDVGDGGAADPAGEAEIARGVEQPERGVARPDEQASVPEVRHEARRRWAALLDHPATGLPQGPRDPGLPPGGRGLAPEQ